MNDLIEEKFIKNGGFLSKISKLTRSEKYQLYLAFQNGKVNRVKRGLYRLSNSPVAFQEAEVAQIVPPGIFCMYTAWAYYELSTYIPSEYHIAVPKTYKTVTPDYPPIKIYYWNKSFFDTGLSEVMINGSRVRIYDIERSVCDAVRFRNKIGNEMLSEILQSFIRRKDKNLDKLYKYAEKLRISKTLDQLIQVLL
jgi:predicted transcriptional regulator of viral defense system